MERLHGVGRNGLLGVPLPVNQLLQPRKAVSPELECGSVLWHTDIIHKDTELSDAKPMHVGKLMHDAVEHVGLSGVGEGLPRMDGPDEVDLALMSH